MESTKQYRTMFRELRELFMAKASLEAVRDYAAGKERKPINQTEIDTKVHKFIIDHFTVGNKDAAALSFRAVTAHIRIELVNGKSHYGPYSTAFANHTWCQRILEGQTL